MWEKSSERVNPGGWSQYTFNPCTTETLDPAMIRSRSVPESDSSDDGTSTGFASACWFAAHSSSAPTFVGSIFKWVVSSIAHSYQALNCCISDIGIKISSCNSIKQYLVKTPISTTISTYVFYWSKDIPRHHGGKRLYVFLDASISNTDPVSRLSLIFTPGL